MGNRRFPAEWERQQGTILNFPHNGNDWPGKFGAIQWAFVEFIKKVASAQAVHLIVADESWQARVAEMLELAHVNVKSVSYIPLKTNRSWMRDSSPILVRNGGELEALNFNFNGWAKYKNYRLDRKVPEAMAAWLDAPLTQVMWKGKPVTLEGGALEVNGKGTMLTTEECLLSESVQVRNPGFTREDYEGVFAEYLGCTNTIWLGDGITGDDTHGHIDDLARFTSADTIVTVVEDDPQDANYHALQDNLKRLQTARLENGKAPNVVELPMPAPLMFEGLRLPASYANFLIINGAVLVPVFNDANDAKALTILEGCFPDRKVIPISAIDLIWGFGTLHCLSQQVPAV